MKQPSSKSRNLRKKSAMKKWLAIGLVVLLFVGAALWALDWRGIVDLPFLSNEDPDTEIASDNIDYGPPTLEELEETEQHKDDLKGQTNSDTPSTPNQKKTVTPFITSWGQNSATQSIEVSGYVDGVLESGGTCTVVLEKDGQQVTAAGTGTINAQNTSCGFISVERSKLSAGSWNITLSYSSANAEGSSQPVTQQVN